MGFCGYVGHVACFVVAIFKRKLACVFYACSRKGFDTEDFLYVAFCSGTWNVPDDARYFFAVQVYGLCGLPFADEDFVKA